MDDLISRQAVLNILKRESHKWGNDCRDWEEAINEITQMPSAEKTGRWYVKETYPLESHSWECSECQEIIFAEKTNYCPNCGARMIEEGE